MAKGIESKGAFKARLKREGRWSNFVKLRESLKANGIAPKDAWRIFREQFPPLALQSSALHSQ